MGDAFPYISAFGGNACQIHYFPEKETAIPITTKNMYLLDSGGQYLDGTVDCTRTIHMGSPNSHQKDKFTKVLLGNLAVERTQWPKEKMLTTQDMDVLARVWIYQEGIHCEYGDNGHGVGHFSGVHESPPDPD